MKMITDTLASRYEKNQDVDETYTNANMAEGKSGDGSREQGSLWLNEIESNKEENTGAY